MGAINADNKMQLSITAIIESRILWFAEKCFDSNYSVAVRNPQFQDKVEKWKGTEKNQRNVNIQEAKKVVC
jgi:hypothetical protein